MSKAIQLNVVSALDRIGKTNGTALPHADPPNDINDKEAWQKERAASFELLIAQQIASYADKRVEKAKSNVRQSYDQAISSIAPGSSNTIVRGNVALNVEVRKPPARLDRALLISAMIKHGITPDVAEMIINEGSQSTKPPTYFKPAIVS